MISRANKTRTTLLKLANDEVVKYLKSNNTIKINGQTPDQRLKSFDIYEIKIQNPIITGIGTKHNRKMLLRRGISNNCSEVVNEFSDDPSNTKDEMERYINELEKRKILFSKNKLQKQTSNNSTRKRHSIKDTSIPINNKDIQLKFSNLKEMPIQFMNKNNNYNYKTVKKGMLTLKKIVNNIKNTSIRNSRKNITNKYNKVSIESPECQKNTSSISIHDYSKALKKNICNPFDIITNSSVSSSIIPVKKNDSPIKILKPNTKANSTTELFQIKRSFNKKKTFNSHIKLKPEFKIELIHPEQESSDDSLEKENIIIKDKKKNNPICVFGKIISERQKQKSPQKKQDERNTNNKIKSKMFKKSKTHVGIKMNKQNKNKLIENVDT